MNNRKITLKEFEDKIKAKEEVQEALLKYISNGESEYVKGLLANVEPTADVNLSGRHGETPLMKAAIKGFGSIVKILVEAKANVNAHDKNGNTALGYAAFNNKMSSTKALIEAKADMEIINDEGQTPLLFAISMDHPKVVTTLLAAKANPETHADLAPLQMAAYKNNVDTIAALLEAKANIEVIDDDKEEGTPLFIAAKSGNCDVVKTLLEAKADTNIIAKHGKTLSDVTKDVDCMVLLKAANPGLFKPATVEAPVVAKAHDVPAAEKKSEKKHRKWFGF